MDDWTQQTGEPANAFKAFTTYHALGPERSLARLRQEIGEGSVPGLSSKSLRWLETWSSKWGWVDRARAWDAHLEALRQRALEASVVRAEELLREAAPDMVEQLLEIAADPAQTGTARVAAAKDVLDRAQVGKRKQEGKLVSTSELGEALVKLLGAGFAEDKPDADAE